MEVLIKIPEEIKDFVSGKKIVSDDTACDYLYELRKSVNNGIVLPEGHGRLVDGDSLWNKMSYYSDNEGSGVDYLNDDVNPTILRDSAMEVIENASTIIEADSESEDNG